MRIENAKKFFDEQVNIPKSQLEKLYYMMLDTWQVYDKFNLYALNAYMTRDDVRDKTFHVFTMIYNRELQYVHYTITPLRYNPYYHNSVYDLWKDGGNPEQERI